jgi:hypothetical protein
MPEPLDDGDTITEPGVRIGHDDDTLAVTGGMRVPGGNKHCFMVGPRPHYDRARSRVSQIVNRSLNRCVIAAACRVNYPGVGKGWTDNGHVDKNAHYPRHNN